MLMCEFFFANQLMIVLEFLETMGFQKPRPLFKQNILFFFFFNLCVFSANINVMKKMIHRFTGNWCVALLHGMLASRGFLLSGMSWG